MPLEPYARRTQVPPILQYLVQRMRMPKQLADYWGPTGEGGLTKIRWGTDGDLTRCARYLRKHVPGREWATCQELHKRYFGHPNPESGGRSKH